MSEHNQVQIVDIGEQADGQRLDNFLIRKLKGVPKSRIYRIIRKGEVRINRKRSKPESRLAKGDKVRIPPIRTATTSKPPTPGEGLRRLLLKSVIFENEQFLVLNKPAGIPAHGGTGIHLGLIEALRQIKDDWQGLELAHRLDRDTSGCMVFAKTGNFLRQFQELLERKEVTKTYLALVHGYWPDSLLEVDSPLTKNRLQSGERMVKVDSAGKKSLTRFEVVERFGREATLVKATPITGRTHQIRVHCQHKGHAILGDAKYASQHQANKLLDATRLCLHAEKIAFKTAEDKGEQQYEAALGDHFREQLKLLRLK